MISRLLRRSSPLKSARVLVVGHDYEKSCKLESQLKSLGASVLVASSIATANKQVNNTDVILVPRETASQLIGDQPKVILAENDRKGLEGLMSGMSNWYVTPLSTTIELGQAILHACEKIDSEETLKMKTDGMLQRACLL